IRVEILRLKTVRPAWPDRRVGLDILEAKLLLAVLLFDQHAHDAAVLQRPEQDLLGERLLDVLLNDARQGPRAELVVIAALGEPLIGLRRELDGDVAVTELRLELEHEL